MSPEPLPDRRSPQRTLAALAGRVRRRFRRPEHRLSTVPVLVLMPHSSCNCRCVMCDIWQANRTQRSLSPEDLRQHVDAFRRLGVRRVVLSGGEALLHQNLWSLCALLKEQDIHIILLSTGLLLAQNARSVVRWCDEVIVSLDGHRAVHDAIRRVPRAFERLAEGIAALRAEAPGYRITARCVIQRRNFAYVPEIIQAARALALDQVSFLAADVSSTAFNRPEGWEPGRVSDVALSSEEVTAFTQVLERVFVHFKSAFDRGFIAESPRKLRHIATYFAALNRNDAFPENVCNAPWVSAVIEADGAVRPCFFHPPYGNLRDQPLDALLNSDPAVAFRRALDIKRNPVCRTCTCTLYLEPPT